jgi:2-polyprenyl-3-methyl-5-hydroxy-6-metoxy-1,4-benzoquinol methylase
MDNDHYYTALASAFVAGRALQRPAGADGAGAVSPDDGPAPLSLHYFKRVPLLPRIQWALGVLRSLQPADLLDIGSGRGKFLWPLLDAFPVLSVTAVDQDPRRVQVLDAVRLGGVDRLTVRRSDVTQLPFDAGAFDVVTLLEVLEHIPAPARALAEVVRVARRSLLISAPSKPDNNPEHIHLFTEADLRAMLGALGVTQVKVQQAPGHWLVLANVERTV